MHGLTMALTQEVVRKGNMVITVSAGYIATERVMAVPEAIRDKIVAQIPVGRLGRPEEAAAESLFWPPMRPPSLPVRICPSTTVSTCIDRAGCGPGGLEKP